jgi:hypothetical protein
MSKPAATKAKPAPTLDLTAAPEEVVAQLRQVTSRKQRAIVRRGGRAVAALIPLADLRLLKRAWEQLEDASDLEYARKMLDDPEQKPVPLSEVRARLGL